MINIVEKETFEVNKQIFNKDIEDTCKYFEMIRPVKEVSQISEALKNYEIFDVGSWKELAKHDIDYRIASKFVKEGKYFVFPILVAKKFDDEFNHFIPKIRFDANMISEYDTITKLGYCILNTDDENVKIVAKCIYFDK